VPATKSKNLRGKKGNEEVEGEGRLDDGYNRLQVRIHKVTPKLKTTFLGTTVGGDKRESEQTGRVKEKYFREREYGLPSVDPKRKKSWPEPSF